MQTGRITLSHDQFADLLTATLATMNWKGCISRVPDRNVLRIDTLIGRWTGHCDVSRATLEDIFNDFRGDTRFTKAFEYIKQCTDIAAAVALKKCFEGVVGPYHNIGAGI